jgi:hypothetical protein
MQLCNRFLHSFVHELLGAQPSDAALADVAEGEDIFAQRLLGFIETG